MRFARREVVEDIDEWHQWFAWYPVRTPHYWVWLEWVTRRRMADAFDCMWVYL